MNFISKITPPFLRQIDRYLLLNSPLVWRTRIHYLLFSFFFGNAAIVGLVYALPISKQFVFAIDTMVMIGVCLLILLFFMVLYWGYTQFKYKLETVGFYPKLLTFSLYFLGASIFLSHFAVLNATLLHRTANVEAVENVKKDRMYLAKNNFIGYISYEEDIRPDLDEKGATIFAAYGYSPAYYKANKQNYNLLEIEDSLDSILAAKDFWENGIESLYYPFFFRDIGMFLLLGFLLVPSCLLLVSYASPKELFLVAFIHFLTAFGSVFSMEMWHIDLDKYYVTVSAILLGISLLMKRNSDWTRLSFFLLLIALPGTAWVTTMEHTNGLRGNLLNEGGIGYGLIVLSVILSVVFASLMAKRLSRPK